MAIQCPHATERPGKPLTFILCAVLQEALGWNHAVDEAICRRCLAAAPTRAHWNDVLDGIFVQELTLRISNRWEWDETHPDRARDDRRAALRNLRQAAGRDAAADALRDAVRHGMPVEIAHALAEEVE